MSRISIGGSVPGFTISLAYGWSFVKDDLRRRGVATWLLGAAADWLRLGGVRRLLMYAWPEEQDELAFATHHGFRELVRTERGWVREPPAAAV